MWLTQCSGPWLPHQPLLCLSISSTHPQGSSLDLEFTTPPHPFSSLTLVPHYNKSWSFLLPTLCFLPSFPPPRLNDSMIDLKMNDDISSRQKVVASNKVGNRQPRANGFLSNQEPVSTQIALVTSTEGGASLLFRKLMTSADYFKAQCYSDSYDTSTAKRGNVSESTIWPELCAF